MSCYLCRTEYRTNWSGFFCNKCKKIQDLLNIYGDRVTEVLDEVLVRTSCQQNNKLKNEIKKEIVKKEYLLRSKTEVKSD